MGSLTRAAGPLSDIFPTSKFTTMNVTSGALPSGVLTGADFVYLRSTGDTPGDQQTLPLATMIEEHGGGPDATYSLRIINTGAGTFTLTGGSGVSLYGTMTVPQNTFRDFCVTFGVPANGMSIQSVGVGTIN